MQLVVANAQKTPSSIKCVAPVNEKDNTIGAFLRIDNPQVVERLKALDERIKGRVGDLGHTCHRYMRYQRRKE